ncbi:GNAT family N-acetyltransferase [Embleya hyalina]|uniref:N-acetyltransferase n=1 Tax=Embleya hyalina TaxID=516124 RepID=A0A401YQZ2_9ACTN|nr:GNAT family N-acetyltransferase [Embleya hyalina]GCD97011.1 N-acetyltransferase [Embleya hyalina]
MKEREQVSDIEIHRLSPADLPARLEGMRDVYRAVFCAEPWNEDETAAERYLERLDADRRRDGFAVTVAENDDVLGFAVAWTTPSVFPTTRSYARVAAIVGAERTEAWLCGAREVDELAVRPGVRGAGVGRALLAAATDDAPSGRCWLLTSAHVDLAVRFYERAGWHRLGTDDSGLTVFVGPRHPAVNDPSAAR